MTMMRPFSTALLLGVPLILSGCQKTVGNVAPPKVEAPADLPSETSRIVVPLTADLGSLERALDAEAPRQLWAIDQHQDDCVKAKRVDIGIAKVKVVPNLGCRIVGQVTRGRIAVSGRGDTLFITMPVNARIAAKDVGGIASKTATGSAVIHATARLSMAGNWQPAAKVNIRYDWREPPGVDFLGRRITFVEKADERLRPVVAQLERTLPRELAKLHLRQQLDGVWRQGFTVISLNRDNPPAWMRITPQKLGFGGYNIAGRRVEMTLAAEALTETFVGADRPADPKATPLPAPSRTIGPRGLRFFIPVLADYRQLEPVVQRTLNKLAAKGITLTGVGPVDAEFGNVTIYATDGNRLAVGVDAKVRARGKTGTTTKGQVWLIAQPYNEPNSQVVRARDIKLAGRTDSSIANMLFALFADDAVQAGIGEGLTHDFAGDYDKVLTAARKALHDRREGDFVLSADIGKVENGQLLATGQGLFLPVRVEGAARIVYRPR